MNESTLLSIAFFIYLASGIGYGILSFKKTSFFRNLAIGALILAWLIQTVALGLRWHVSGHAPFSNMYESLVFFSWAFVLTYFAAERLLKIEKLGLAAMILNMMILGYAFSHDSTIKPLMPALQSSWMILHVISCFLSYGAFAVSFLASIFYLTPLHKKFVSLKQLDHVIYQLILFGFPLLTLGVASGAVWANEAWGAYWSWDPKETWSLITLFVYSIYLHLRLKKNGWQGKKLVWIAFFGFLSVLFTYFGVSYLLSGLHSYA